MHNRKISARAELKKIRSGKTNHVFLENEPKQAESFFESILGFSRFNLKIKVNPVKFFARLFESILVERYKPSGPIK